MTRLIRYCFCLALSSYLLVNVQAQPIFIPGDEVDPRGYIVSEKGETLFRTPPQWHLAPHNRGAHLIREWPAVFQLRNYQRPRQYAILTEDMTWRALDSFAQLQPYQHGFAQARHSKGLSFIIDHEGQVVMDSVSLGSFTANGLAVARSLGREPDAPSYGLLDTNLHWHWPPEYTRIRYLQQDRYLVTDTSGRQAVLNAAGTVYWPWRAEGHRIIRNAQFDDSGHIFLYESEQTYSIRDKQGKVQATNVRGYVNTFADGRARTFRGKHYGFLDPTGTCVVPAAFEKALHFTEERALVLDTTHRMLGYLDPTGQWAIAPQFVYGTTFLDGVAVVAGDGQTPAAASLRQRDPQDQLTGEIGSPQSFGFLRAIDPAGHTLWSDSCRSVQLLPGQLLLIHYGYMRPAPAYRLISLKTELDWLPASFTLTDWHIMDDLPYDLVRRMDVGLGKMSWQKKPTLHLPNNYQEQLARLPQLRSLAVGGHILSAEQLAHLLSLNQLTRLSLERCGLTSLPNSIRQLEQLEELDLSKNQLTELPRAIYRMRHLRKLNITDNPLPHGVIPRLRKALPETEIVYKGEW